MVYNLFRGNCETVFRSYWLEKWRGIGSSWVNWMIWLQQSWYDYELLLVSHHLAQYELVSLDNLQPRTPNLVSSENNWFPPRSNGHKWPQMAMNWVVKFDQSLRYPKNLASIKDHLEERSMFFFHSHIRLLAASRSKYIRIPWLVS